MNKVALITGSSRGIGLGIARELAGSGFDLVINGVRKKEQVKEILEEIERIGVGVIYCQGNVAKAQDRERIVTTVREHYGRLNILVNNAGVAPKVRNDILKTTEESYDYVMDVNLKGPYFLTQIVADWMVEQKGIYPGLQACIINVSSVSAAVASTDRGEYCISKAGMSMLTQLFAVRLGEYDIPVYEIRPGIMKTDMTRSVKGKYDKMIEEGMMVQKRWGLPEDVGRTATALATGMLPYSTGQVIMVDGGMTLPRL